RSKAAVLIAPHDTTTMSAEYSSCVPSHFTTTLLTSLPEGFVSSRSTKALVSRVTLGNESAGSTAQTWASDLAWTRHGKPSQVSQRMQALLCGAFSSSMTPSGV